MTDEKAFICLERSADLFSKPDPGPNKFLKRKSSFSFRSSRGLVKVWFGSCFFKFSGYLLISVCRVGGSDLTLSKNLGFPEKK